MTIHNFGCGGGCCNDLNRQQNGCVNQSNCGCGCHQHKDCDCRKHHDCNRPMFCCMGPQGPAGVSEYAHFYNLTTQTVDSLDDVNFGANGLTSGTVTHVAGEEPITFTEAGTYLIYVRTVTQTPARFAVYLNGAPVPGGTFSSGTVGTTTSGITLVTVPQGAIMTLRNLEQEPVVLNGATVSATDTTDTVNAELVALKLA